MRIQEGERWRCLNDACGGEIMVLVSGQLEGESPRCSCGSVMKKHYNKPTLWSHDDTGALERLAGRLIGKIKNRVMQSARGLFVVWIQKLKIGKRVG